MHKLFRASNAYLSHFHGRGDALAFTAGELRTPSRRAASGAQARHPQISHPWPEWVNLMELLLSRGYFGGGNEIPLQSGKLGRTESNLIRTACLNFSRDRFDIIRLLSHKNIRVIAACGCPNLDRKVINAGKRLRAHVGVDEEDTCRSCRLRGNCGRAFVKAREDEGGRTVDIMRIILSYGLDQFPDTVRKELCLDETVEKSVRILLKEMVECSERALESNIPKSGTSEKVAPVEDDSISLEKYPENGPMKTGEWLCPKCKFLNFAKNIKCSRCEYLSEVKLAQFKLEQEHLPLLKGDWICSKCNFLNFARNTRCGICKEKPPKRQLSPGEWECPSCNYINFRRNMVCLKCDHRRPKMANSANTSSENLLTNTGAVANAGVNARTCAQQRSQMGYGEQSCLKSSDRACDFVDFPISGGSSDLSRNAEKIERWKLEMRDRSKGIVKVIKNGEFRPRGIPRSLENVSDVEDVADWFNPKKTESCLAR